MGAETRGVSRCTFCGRVPASYSFVVHAPLPSDCNGYYIQPAAATMRSSVRGYPGSNCIANNSALCHSQSGASEWIEIDLGQSMAVSKVVVRNRGSCCQDRIGEVFRQPHSPAALILRWWFCREDRADSWCCGVIAAVSFSIAIFSASGGIGFETPVQTFVSTQSVYTFNFPDGGCPSSAEKAIAASLGLARCVPRYSRPSGVTILLWCGSLVGWCLRRCSIGMLRLPLCLPQLQVHFHPKDGR
jgi:hypothetical protein